MICSKCNKECEEGTMVCDICGEALMEPELHDVKYLLTVANETEKAIVEDILKDAEINIVEKNNMAFGSIIGAMPLGFDIYVRSEDWKMARDILESDDFETENIEELYGENLQEEIKDEDLDDISNEEYKKYETKIAIGLIILLVLFAILIFLAY